MTTSNVPLPTFGPDGFTSPAELAVYNGVMADFNAAFGGNLNTAKSTPQGQLATTLAALLGSFNDLFVDYVNQSDPAYAAGRMQDAIGHIYFLDRIGGEPTTVTATCNGAAGTFLAAGSLARASDDTIYQSLADATIPAGGSVSVPFAAVTVGPIACPAGTLDRIYRAVPGWDSITNPLDGALGRLEETPAQFEARRAQSVAINAIGILPAVRGAVLAVPGVVDAYVTENNTGAPVTVDGQTLVAHSLYVAVRGGANANVAKAIWSKKGGGCAYNGATSVTVTDTNSGYVTPPTYVVKFQRAADLAINFAIDLAGGSDVPSDAEAQISAVLSTQLAALARIGQTLYASQFVTVVAALGSWVRISALTINSGASQAVGIDDFPVMGAVTVTIV